jgi:hypothetical protein
MLCGWCGAPVAYQGRGQPRRYCCPPHAVAAKRARQAARQARQRAESAQWGIAQLAAEIRRHSAV